MTAETQPLNQESFLIADCGSMTTTVALLDVVEDSYRLVARATAPTTTFAPISNSVQGIQQAIGRISEITGRTLLNEQGGLIKPTRANGAGVDHFAVVASAAPPLKTLLVGLYSDVSLASGRRVLHSTYAQEGDTFSLADTRSEAEQLTTIVNLEPDLVLITGGTDDSKDKRLLRMIETVALGLGILSTHKPAQVLYGGNKALREDVNQLLGDRATLHVVANVRPTLEEEQLDEAIQTINRLYDELKLDNVPGIREVNDWSDTAPLSTASAFALISQYFASLHGQVVGVDLGTGSTTFVWAGEAHTNLSTYSDLGTGRSLAGLLAHIPLERILDWIPADMEAATVHDFIYHKQLHPQTVPVTEEELHIEQAIAREILRCGLTRSQANWGWPSATSLPACRLLLARGSTLVNAPHAGQAALMLLDALQPTGIFSLALDKLGILPALGALARDYPLPVIQTLAGGVLTNLGWVIVPVGQAQPGETVLVVESDETQLPRAEVEYGSLEVLPLAPGATAEIKLTPQRGFDIGFGPGEGKQVTMRGGAVGLIIDARGRPLQLPQETAARRSLLRQWLWDVGG